MIAFLLWRETGKFHGFKINDEKHFLYLRIRESVQGTSKPQLGVQPRDTQARRDPLAKASLCRTQGVDLSLGGPLQPGYIRPVPCRVHKPGLSRVVLTVTLIFARLGCSSAPYTFLKFG